MKVTPHFSKWQSVYNVFTDSVLFIQKVWILNELSVHSMSKLKTCIWVNGEDHTRLILVPPNSTVREMLEMAKTRSKKPDLACVWLEGAELYLDDPFEDWYDRDAIFCLTSTSQPPSEDLLHQLMMSRSGTPTPAAAPAAPVAPPAAPVAPPAAPVAPPAIGQGSGQTRADVGKSVAGVIHTV